MLISAARISPLATEWVLKLKRISFRSSFPSRWTIAAHLLETSVVRECKWSKIWFSAKTCFESLFRQVWVKMSTFCREPPLLQLLRGDGVCKIFQLGTCCGGLPHVAQPFHLDCWLDACIDSGRTRLNWWVLPVLPDWFLAYLVPIQS